MRNVWIACTLFCAAVASAQPSFAQSWTPQRHVEITVPNAQNSVLDTTARVIHRIMQDQKWLPVTSTLVNRAGGEQVIGYTYLRTRTGDAHYLSFANPALLSNHIAGRQAFTYTDFTPIAFMLTDDYIFAVRADHPLKDGRDLADALRKQPDSLAIGIGNTTHRIALGMALQSAKVDIKRVKMVVLQQGTQATSALGGHIDVAVSPLAQLLPHIEAGKLRVLAVSAPRRKPGILASVPTWPELGYKEGTYETWRAVIAPKDITQAQTAFWEDVMRKVAQSDDFKKAAEKFQWDIDFKGAAETRKLMEDEYARTRGVMSYLGLIP
jgi:putative tricarboxylic transport membrane protein